MTGESTVERHQAMAQMTNQNFIIDQAHAAYAQFRNANIDHQVEDMSNVSDEDDYGEEYPDGEGRHRTSKIYQVMDNQADTINISIEKAKSQDKQTDASKQQKI